MLMVTHCAKQNETPILNKSFLWLFISLEMNVSVCPIAFSKFTEFAKISNFMGIISQKFGMKWCLQISTLNCIFVMVPNKEQDLYNC